MISQLPPDADEGHREMSGESYPLTANEKYAYNFNIPVSSRHICLAWAELRRTPL